ncbi:helix-turn-helix family protein [Delftia acidovorans]|nr:helix-turn-helix family protein [Delftia acidovorans]
MDRSYVSLIELGRNSPSIRMLFQLCDALDITPSALIKDVEKRMKVIGQGSDPAGD